MNRLKLSGESKLCCTYYCNKTGPAASLTCMTGPNYAVC